jgi:hypothetical protein
MLSITITYTFEAQSYSSEIHLPLPDEHQMQKAWLLLFVVS